MWGINVDVHHILKMTAQIACPDSVCSGFWSTRKFRPYGILRLIGRLEVCAGAKQHGCAPDVDHQALQGL